MLSVDQWEYLAVACGALIGVITLAGLVWRGVRRMYRLARQVLREARDFFIQVNGSADRPPMMEVLEQTLAVSRDNAERLTRLERRMTIHENGGQQPRRKRA